jgi:ADP-heptose:LPS heptosyltransferase
MMERAGTGKGRQVSSIASSPRRIALVRMDNLGDHVLGAGVIPALRAHHPQSELVAFVPTELKDLYARCTDLNLTVGLPPASAYLKSEASWASLLQELRALPKFDLVINPRFAEDWYAAGLICAAVADGTGRVLGFRQPFSPIPGFDPNLCYTQLTDAPEGLHTALYGASIASAAVGRSVPAPPRVWFGAADWAAVSDVFSLSPRGYVVIGLGASFPYKRPAAQTYQHIVRRLLAQSNRVMLTGTDTERPLADLLLEDSGRDARLVSVCGRLRLFELAALLASARLYIGPDAGPKHMAAACGTPVMELGWVPAGYPVSSRGPGTAGTCWAAWQTLSRTVGPSMQAFADAAARTDFYSVHIAGIDPLELDLCIAELLELTQNQK